MDEVPWTEERGSRLKLDIPRDAPAARRDLSLRSRRRRRTARAKRRGDEVRRRLRTPSQGALAGAAIEGSKVAHRKLPAEGHLIVLRIEDGVIEVVRSLHRSQDLTRRLR